MADIVLNGNFDGDYFAYNYIYPTITNRSALIPGVTTNDEISVSTDGTSAYYYNNPDPAVTNGTSGRDFTTSESGTVRVTFVLNESLQLDEKMPGVVSENATVDLVGDKAVKGSIKIANAWSAYGTSEMVTNGTETTVNADTPLSKTNIYQTIVEMGAEYAVANPEAEAVNYVMVSDQAYAVLLQADEFISNDNASPVVNGQVGSVAGLSVVKNAALEKSATWAGVAIDLSKTDMIVGHYSAFGAPTNLQSFRVKDSENFVGSRVQGEVSYGFETIDGGRIYYHNNAA